MNVLREARRPARLRRHSWWRIILTMLDRRLPWVILLTLAAAWAWPK